MRVLLLTNTPSKQKSWTSPQRWFSFDSGLLRSGSSYSGWWKGLFCCSRVSSDMFSDKLFCVCESWCRFPVIMLVSSLSWPAVVLLASSALLQHKSPRGAASLPGEGQTDSAAQTAILLWLPLLFVFFINPCSLSLTLHIALRWICLVLAQRVMKPLWCDPIQWSQL